MYDKTAELLPIKFELDLPKFEVNLPKIELNLSKCELELSNLKFEPYKPVVPIFFKIENMNATTWQKFKNPCKENSSKLRPIPNELWLQIFSYLNSNALVCAMISCKFFGEITNEQSIRNRLGERTRQIKSARFINISNQLYFDIYSHYGSNCGLGISLPEEKKELYQPGDKGFVMK